MLWTPSTLWTGSLGLQTPRVASHSWKFFWDNTSILLSWQCPSRQRSVGDVIILHRALELRLPFQTNLHLMDILLPGPQLQPGWSPFYCFPGLGFLKVSHTSKDDVWRLLSLACFIQHNDLQLHSACWKWQDFVSFGSYILLFGIGSTFSLFLHLLMDTGWFHIFTIVITALAKYLGAHPKDFSYLRKLTWVNFNF